MNKEEIKHINWMYNRLISVHKENPNIDYMKRFKKIIDKQLALCSVSQQRELLLAYEDYLNEYHTKEDRIKQVDKYLKANNCG